MTAARNDAYPFRIDVNGEAIAVPFVFEQPVRTFLRRRPEQGSTRSGIGSNGRLGCSALRLRTGRD
jgi:hypothetical protein